MNMKKEQKNDTNANAVVKKLRRNIICINMVLVGLVLIFIVSANCYSAWNNTKRSLTDSLSQTLFVYAKDKFAPDKQFDIQNEPLDKKEPDKKLEDLFLISYYTVLEVSSSGEVTEKYSSLSLDSSVSDEVVAAANASQKDSQILWKEHIIYLKWQTSDNCYIIFTQTSYLTNSLLRSLALSAALCLIALLGLFLISIWLSDYAVKPVAYAWQQQKQFIADASHELKTPLTVMIANNNIVMSHPKESVESQMKWLESSAEVAEHMKYLINQMLFLAKSDANRVQVVCGEVDFGEVLEETILNFEPVAYEKEVLIQYEPISLSPIQSDPALLRQLLGILFDNAVKYSDKQTQIEVTVKQETNKLTFSVTNTGKGVAAQDLPHLFERFYRTDKARSEGGYGLGLAIAKSIVQQLGGEISAQSDGVRKTTFTVILP